MNTSRTLNRLRLAVYHSGVSVLSSLLAFANTLLAVSLTITYLGEERFGVWMTVASISTMLTFLDFGVGNGMVSQIARSRVSDNSRALGMTATRGFIILIMIGAAVGVVLSLLNAFYPVANIMNIESATAQGDALQLISVFIVIFSINIPLNGLFKVMQGLQLGWVMHSVRCCASVVSLLLIIILAANQSDPVYLLLATYGITTLAPLVLVPYLIAQKVLVSGVHNDWSAAKTEYRTLISFGGLFLALQLGIMVGWGSDAFIISALNSAAAVAQYAVVQRMFQLVTIPLNILNTPLWGAYADAHAQGDTAFIRKTLKISLSGTLALAIALSVALYFISDWLLDFWIDDHIKISSQLILAFAVWKVLQGVGNAFSMALNGMHIVKIQVYSIILLCLLTIPLKLIYTPTFGAVGVVWSTVVAYGLSTILFLSRCFSQTPIRRVPHGKPRLRADYPCHSNQGFRNWYSARR